MKVYIKEFRLKGLKNIQNSIKINFMKNIEASESLLKHHNIKAIYGPNGSGKTAIVHAFKLFKSILLNDGFLQDSNNTKYLKEILNKQSDTIDLGFDFIYEKSKNYQYYSYEISITKEGNGFIINNEIYKRLKNKQKDSEVIFESRNGKEISSKLDKIVSEAFVNLLNKQSFFNIFTQDFIAKDEIKESTIEKTTKLILPLAILAMNLNVILDDKDDHMRKITTSSITKEKLIKSFEYNQKIDKSFNYEGYSTLELTNKEYDDFMHLTKKKEKFIKLFKPDIVSIDLDKRVIEVSNDKETLQVNQYINYGNYKIDLEFESAGIKKLIDLYSALNASLQGEIVVIDELDSNINDVYLVELIKFLSQHGNGQLIFTTHNVSPMDALKSKKQALDFMTQDGKIVTWKQIGNYSPTRLYKQGFIDGLPFNVDSAEFLGVFDAQ